MALSSLSTSHVAPLPWVTRIMQRLTTDRTLDALRECDPDDIAFLLDALTEHLRSGEMR